jgi:hypothetical protein
MKMHEWAKHRKHPNSAIDFDELAKNLIIFVIFLLLFIITWKNIPSLNTITMLFIRLGSLILIIFTIVLFVYFIKIMSELFAGFKGLTNAIKFTMLFMLLLAVIYLYTNQDVYVQKTVRVANGIDYDRFNPVQIELRIPGTAESAETKCSKSAQRLAQLEQEKATIDFSYSLLDVQSFATKEQGAKYAQAYATVPQAACIKNYNGPVVVAIMENRYAKQVVIAGMPVLKSSYAVYCDDAGVPLQQTIFCIN